MANIDKGLLESFRTPAFPGSFFLSFEGIEGAGKSTQIKNIVEFLEKKDFRVITLREPGGTVFGEKLRKAILDSGQDILPVAESTLFASSRAQLLNDVILPELSTPGTVIICDRYIDSSLAYQGIARELGPDYVLGIHNIFPLNLVPHLTLYLKISVETSNNRQKMRNAPKDYFERKGDQFYKKLIEGYDLAKELFPNRIRVIDAEQDETLVTQSITNEISKLILC